MVDNSTQTMPIITPSTPVCSNTTSPATNTAVAISCVSTTSAINGHLPTLCGPNRIQHANSLEPSVPCYALSSIVSSLNAQISLLLVSIEKGQF